MSAPVVKIVAGLVVWVTFAVLLATAFSAWYVADRIRNPVEVAFEIKDFRVLNPVVKPGDTVHFELTGVRRYACPSIIAAFWVDEDGAPVTRFPPITGGYSPLGDDGYVIPVRQLAPDRDTVTGEQVPPGIYHYKSVNAPLCRNLLPTETPDVAICLVVPGLPTPPCAENPELIGEAVHRVRDATR